ncbi:MAG: 3-oxoacyl-[acyl-carrier-protein] reductase [Alphaproteobacteria bacterium 41-28]|nr:MAG: 3-oxoacyl-[acyl-carrier-protein] reductase [Alphaproteobacteria bacterium 41-28]
MFELKGKKALITGATGGLGAEIARALHQQGATIAISGTRKEKLDELAKELGDRVKVIPCDLSQAESTQKLIPEAEFALGGLDILVNNAGLTQDGLMLRMSDEQWSKVIEVNLSSAFRLSREAIKGMMKQRSGRIINITSIVGVTGNAGQANYAASKAGLIGLSKSLAAEVATRGITVNCIAPGFIESPMTDVLNEKQREKILSEIPQGEIGSPLDIAAGVVYLASNEAKYVTGQTLHINGGMAMV